MGRAPSGSEYTVWDVVTVFVVIVYAIVVYGVFVDRDRFLTRG